MLAELRLDAATPQGLLQVDFTPRVLTVLNPTPYVCLVRRGGLQIPATYQDRKSSCRERV